MGDRRRPREATSGAFSQLSPLSRPPEHKRCKQNKKTKERRMKTKPLLKFETRLVLVRGLSNRKKVIHLAK